MIWVGMTIIAVGKLTELLKRCQMPGAYMICMVMLVSGVKIRPATKNVCIEAAVIPTAQENVPRTIIIPIGLMIETVISDSGLLFLWIENSLKRTAACGGILKRMSRNNLDIGSVGMTGMSVTTVDNKKFFKAIVPEK